MNIFLELLLWTTYVSALYFAVFWLLTFLEKRESFKEEEERIRELKRYPLVSVIIPAYNAEDTIDGCLASVVNLNYPKKNLEIIVINDGSQDYTEKKIKEFISHHKGLNITLISQENKGKAAALNNALEIARGELFACLDSDSFVEPETLKKMVHVFLTNGDDLTIVTPALKISKPKNLLQKMQHVEYLVSMFLNRVLSHLDSNYVAQGPFSLYKKKTVIETGGFDQSNLTEDQEIAYRMQSKHFDIIHCHDAYVHTVAPENLKKLSRQRNRWYKGGLINLVKYRRIILNKQYGHFGMFQLPLLLFLSLGAIATVIFFNYYVTWPIIKNMYNLSLVGFDILPYLSTFTLSFDLLDIDLSKTMMTVSALFLTSLIIFISIKNAKERVSAKALLYIIPYFLVYYIIMSFIAFFSLVEFLMGRTQKW